MIILPFPVWKKRKFQVEVKGLENYRFRFKNAIHKFLQIFPWNHNCESVCKIEARIFSVKLLHYKILSWSEQTNENYRIMEHMEDKVVAKLIARSVRIINFSFINGQII